MNVQLLGGNQALPSFFEVFMIDRTSEALQPAFEYLVQVLGENYPNSIFNYLAINCDEAYAVMLFLIQNYHLRRLGENPSLRPSPEQWPA